MGKITGIGQYKLEKYGDAFLELVCRYQGVEAPVQEQKNPVEEVKVLIQSGTDIPVIADKLSLTKGAVYGFLAKAIQHSELALEDITRLSVMELQQIEASIQQAEGDLRKAGKLHRVRCDTGLLKCIKADMLRRSVL